MSAYFAEKVAGEWVVFDENRLTVCTCGDRVDDAKSIAAALTGTDAVIEAAREVIACWEDGDLADAVHELDVALIEFDNLSEPFLNTRMGDSDDAYPY